MCNCGNYCPHCGQLKTQPTPWYGWYDYRTYPYPTWHPVTTTPVPNYTTTDGLGQKYDGFGNKIYG